MFLLKKDLKTVLRESPDKILRFTNMKYRADAVVDLHFSDGKIWCRYDFKSDGYLEEWYILLDQEHFFTLFADDITTSGELIIMTAADVETFEKDKTKHLRGL